MVEGLWEKGGHAMAFDFAIQVREDHFRVAAEFPQDLPACAARRHRQRGIGDDRQARERTVTVGQGLEHRHPLGTDGEAVGGVLDVAAGDDGAVGRLERGADLDIGECRVRALPRHSGAARVTRAHAGACCKKYKARLARNRTALCNNS